MAMAKKQVINKTQAVRDYLKSHRGAMSGEIAAALSKKGIKITPSYVANIKTTLNKSRTTKKALAAKPVKNHSPELATVAVEKPAKAGDTITLEHIKAVAQMTRTVGGVNRLNELLGLVKEVGGVKKFKDLLEAMFVPEADDVRF
jgi:hypothetical protein